MLGSGENKTGKVKFLLELPSETKTTHAQRNWMVSVSDGRHEE
jgi:hypothetical protein